jgi:hypothetical protein
MFDGLRADEQQFLINQAFQGCATFLDVRSRYSSRKVLVCVSYFFLAETTDHYWKHLFLFWRFLFDCNFLWNLCDKHY